MMRYTVLAALCLGGLPCLAADGTAGFSGAWVGWLCPPGAQQNVGQCSNFMMELHQDGNRLCGVHAFATPGASRMDEGTPPSISGEVSDDTASVVVVSSRASPPVRVRAELKMAGGALQWQRLENPGGDYLLPMSARLIRSKSKSLFAPVFARELKAACTAMFTAATKAADQAAPPPLKPIPLPENLPK